MGAGRRTCHVSTTADAEFMKLQAESSDSPPIYPICTLEHVRHLLLESMTSDAVSDEVKSALAGFARRDTRAGD